MAKIPYQPVPSQTPTSRGLPSVRPQIPDAAFGGESAKALSNVGSELRRSGDVLFRRAIALQQIENETEAREADVAYTIEAGKLNANYMSLQGKSRVDGRSQYEQNLRALQERIGEGVSNPAARRMYDAASLPSMARGIASAAGAAATAHKSWSIATAKAQLELDTSTIADDPSDPDLFQDNLAKIQESAEFVASLQGYPANSAPAKLTVLQATSGAWSQRIAGLARTEPFEASKLLKENKKNFTADDYLQVEAIVISQSRAVGAANIAEQVYDPTKSFTQMEAEAGAAAESFSPDDPLLKKQAITDVSTRYRQQKYVAEQEQLEAKQTIASAIQEAQPTSLRELLLVPEAAAAYNRLPSDAQNAIPGQINRYVAALGSPDNELNYTRLVGMAASDDPEARKAFMGIDATAQSLSQPQIRSIMAMQEKLRGATSGDQGVSKAVTWLRGSMGAQLEALDVFKRTEDNKDEYDQFVGALHSALSVWRETHGKDATYKDVTDVIGPQIVRERTEPYFFGLLESQTPFFTQDVPEEFSASIRKAAGDPNLPEAQIYKMWIKLQFMQLYGATPKAPAPPPPTGPQVPTSE